MKNIAVVIFFSMLCLNAGAQFYYNDIIGTRQANQQYKNFKNQQVTRVNATSFEGNSQPLTDFLLEQAINFKNQQVITHSRSVSNGESFFISLFENERVVKTVDSNASAINTVLYDYDSQGRIKTVQSSNKDFDGILRTTELHNWMYNEKGMPEKMLKVKNNTDTTVVTFKYDDAGNTGEEVWKKNNRVTETYYYFYNAKQQLTDIVRFNAKARRMLPDYIFEYNDEGNISQMTQMQTAGANYYVWRYIYNTKGLKEKELVFNKQKDLLGKIEYAYQ